MCFVWSVLGSDMNHLVRKHLSHGVAGHRRYLVQEKYCSLPNQYFTKLVSALPVYSGNIRRNEVFILSGDGKKGGEC